MKISDFLNLNYNQRQIIGFIEDIDYQKAQEKLNKESNINTNSYGKILGSLFSGSMVSSISAVGLTFSNPITLTLLAGAGLTLAATQLYEKYKTASENGIDITLLPISIAKNITLPIGHPRKGIVYVGHPSIPDCYFPYADFHRALFEHKSCELISLLMSLGAKTITVHHEQGWSSDIASNISLGIPAAKFDSKFDAEINKSSKDKILYKAQFKGCNEPKIPENLIWFKYEPTWQQVAAGRINYGSESFSLNLTYNEDFGVNGQLKTKLEKSGLELGGDFKEQKSTVWIIEGSFV